jgi:predicted hotdog family 3-hydroxylacyl-ACP dehydratase
MAVLNQAEIDQLLPHAGNMCLLHAVQSWDEAGIVCTGVSHHHADNPLRYRGELPAISGLEYAAQAMAVHCGLLAQGNGSPPAAGYLGAVRDLKFQVERLDDVPGEITIAAERLIGDRSSAMYAFRITARDRELLAGRASVFLQYSEGRG